MVRWIPSFALVLFSLQPPGPVQAALQPVERRTIIIAQVSDGESETLDELDAMMREEILALVGAEIDVRFPPDKRQHGGWSTEGIRTALAQALADESVDLVIADGPAITQVVVRGGPPPKPVIAPLGVDAEMQGLPSTAAASGIHNLSYLVDPHPVGRDLPLFAEITPFEHLAVFVSRPLLETLPDAAPRLAELLDHAGIVSAVQVIAVGDSVAEAVARLEPAVDAVYLTPLLQLPGSEIERLIDALNERRLPTFSLLGRPDVQRGALAGRRPDQRRQLARRVALHVHRILSGEDAGTLPVSFTTHDQLVINMATARAIGRYPTYAVLTEATLLDEDVIETERQVSLESAVEEAIAANLDLRAGARAVAAGEQEIERARALLRPQLDARTLGLQIDEERASPLTGAERTLSASVGVEQLLYSESATANLSIQRSLQVTREEELERLRLDIAEEAATSYLDVLRAKTFQRIERQNLRLARENLELARVRVEVGAASRAEVLRWETEINSARIRVLDADALRSQAELALNRLLHRPFDEVFQTVDPDLEERGNESYHEIEPYVDNPKSFSRFNDFMVEWGLGRAPELRTVDAGIAAQERALLAARRAFWLPDVALSAELEEILEESGQGADSTGPALPGISLPGDTRWSVAVQARLPLFAGGARSAERIQAQIDLSHLELERSALAERLELRIRSTLVEVRTSFSAIDLARQAAAAARENLQLVTDSYSRGALDILDLLDAQNAALQTEAAAANAVNDFFLDLMAAQRAANNFHFFESEPEHDAWLEALAAYFRSLESRP